MNEQIVLDHMPLACKMAKIKSLSAPPSVSFEELKSAAYMGLVDAALKFDPNRGSAFSSYARTRIDGEMKDFMRRSLFGSRTRPIMDGEDFPEMRDEVPRLDLDLSCLSPRETKILGLYYIDRKAMKEIGVSEGVGESRVSQILDSCRRKLKRHLSKDFR